MTNLKKYILLILVFGMVFSAYGQGKFAAKLGANFGGSFELDSDEGGSKDGDVATGFEIDLEYHHYMNKQLIIGGGVGYLFNRRGEDSPDDFSLIPIYGLIKYEIEMEGNFVPAIEGHFGYNAINYNCGDDDLSVDASGGTHYGMGFSGTINQEYLIGIGYYVYNASATVSSEYLDKSESGDAKYSCITLNIGILFGGK